MKISYVKQIGPKVTKEDMAVARILQTIDDYIPGNKKALLKGIIKIAKEGLE